MLDISTIKTMDTADILRSGALLLAVTTLLIGTSKSSSKYRTRDAVGLWLLGDAIFLALNGLCWFSFPEFFMKYMCDGTLDVYHFCGGRLLGAALIGFAVTGYLFRDSPNRDMWVLTRFLCYLVYVMMLVMGYVQQGEKSTITFNDKYVTFGTFSAVLWTLGHLCVYVRLPRIGSFANKQGNVQAATRSDKHLLADLVLCTMQTTLAIGFPLLSHTLLVEKIVTDQLHSLIAQIIGTLTLNFLMVGLCNFQSNDRLDKRAYALGRLLMYMCICPVYLWYFWQYQFFPAAVQSGVWVLIIGGLVNLGFAVYA